MIFSGLMQAVKNMLTAINGKETHGIIMDVHPNGSSVNGYPVLDAEIAIVEDNGMIGMYRETVGTDYNKYQPGEFLKLKHRKTDINILEKVDSFSVPCHLRERLESEAEFISVGLQRYDSQSTMFGNSSCEN